MYKTYIKLYVCVVFLKGSMCVQYYTKYITKANTLHIYRIKHIRRFLILQIITKKL